MQNAAVRRRSVATSAVAAASVDGRRSAASTRGGPPPARGPVGPPPKKSTKRRSGDPLWARLMVILGALLMVASGGAIVGSETLMSRLTGSIGQDNLLNDAGGVAGRDAIDGPIDMLLVGVDERPDNPGDPIRADSIIIVHINAAHNQAYLVSIPRDLMVDIPAYKKTGFTGGRDKINGAFAAGSDRGGGRAGGVELLALTIKRFTGITFDAAAIVDFGGFQKVVEVLGGVDMCVKQRVASEHIGYDRKGNYLHPRDGGKPYVHEPGCRRMVPWQALDYVRQRKQLDNGDYDRQQNQQQFVKAIVKEAKKQGVTSNPVKAAQVMNAAGKALTIDRNGVSIQDWLYTLRGVADNEIVMLKTNGGTYAAAGGSSSAETLTPESLTMFKALRDDKLAEFVATYPQFVSSEAAG
jgi:LCP family protein required for cell wall assembly